jgi:DNA adenine methylase
MTVMTERSRMTLPQAKTVAPRIVERRLDARGRLRGPGEAAPAGDASPFVKWVGGKTRLLGELTARAPSSYGRYFEPFVGGGALFFRLRPAAACLSDLNADLIGVYQAVRDDVDAVIRNLGRHRTLHSEAYYYQVRERWNAGLWADAPAARAAAFLYMNKTCYNGLWRVNKRGEFNVPAGRYVNPGIVDEDGLRAASVALRDADVQARPFDRVLDEAEAGDFVYFDPPYDPISDTADFTSYTTSGFGGAEQAALAQTFRALADRGCAVMLSNSDTPLVRKLYAGFHIERVSCNRAINSRADARGAVAEVIVSNPF